MAMTARIKALFPCAAIFVLLTVKIVGFFYPSARLWGVNQFAYFSLPFAIISLVVIFTFIFLIACRAKLKSTIKFIENFIAFIKILPRTLFLPAGVGLILFLFYIFGDVTNLLGDGLLRIRELETLQHIPPTEPLDYLIHDLSYDHVLKPLGLSALTCYRLWSYLAGLLYILGVWKVASTLKREGIDSALTFAYLMGWGGVMMFFGYVENYAFASVILLFFFNYSIEYIRSGKKLTLVVVLFLLAFFMHNLVIFILPSLIFLLFTRFKKNRIGAISGMSASFLAVFIWIVASYSSKEGSAFLLPDSPSEPGYLLWSGVHLLDILNELLLVSPAFIVLIVIQRINYKKTGLQLRVFFWLAAISSLAVLLLLDPKLGMARDWDLFAMPLLGFHLALFMAVDWQRVGRFVKSAVAVISVTFTIIWVLLNSGEERSLARYKDFMNLENERRCYGYEVLGEYCYKQNLLHEAEQAYSLSVQSKPHYRCYLWLGYIQRKLGKDDQAEKNFKEVLELIPGQPHALNYLGRLHFEAGRGEEAWSYLSQYIQTPAGRNDEEAIGALKILKKELAKE